MNRAYSILEIKQIDEEQRIIEGIASTPRTDRMGDIVESMGAQFTLPIPLLLDHNSREQVGHVIFAKPTKDGIPFKAKITKIPEAGLAQELVDKAWHFVKYRLRQFVSIGFRGLDDGVEVLKTGGLHFKLWEWLELSMVVIPAQPEAVITQLKSIDSELLAATGRKQNGAERTVKAGVTASRSTHVVKAQEARTMPKTIAEQIAGFEATRQAKAAAITAIMEKSAEDGTTLDAAQKEEHDGLVADVKEIDEHIVRLRDLEKMNLSKAIVVDPDRVKSSDDGSRSRESFRVQVMPKKLPPGIGFTRLVMATVRAKGNPMLAIEFAKNNPQWMAESPEVEIALKAAVSAGTTTDTTWASPLVQYQNLASEFVDYTRPLTIVGRIPGLRRVPFKVKIPRQTGASSVGWVGEGKVKKVSALAFDSITLDIMKIAGIVVVTDELVKHSSPSVELLVRDDLAKGIVQYMDAQFVDPTVAATDVSPASVTNGVTPVTATGTNAAALRADLKSLVQKFLDADLSPVDGVWIMSQGTALAISLMTNDLGQPEFPGITMNGGTFMGMPVIASEGVPATGGSPTDGGLIILAKAGDILFADEGGIMIDASREATLQMDDSPDSPPTASTNLISMFQHNLLAIRAEREVNWKKRRTDSVQFIQSAKYADS